MSQEGLRKTLKCNCIDLLRRFIYHKGNNQILLMPLPQKIMTALLATSIACSGTNYADAQESRSCALMIEGEMKTREACTYSESDRVFRVKTQEAYYQLDTNITPPRLYINGKFTKAGNGNYLTSANRACELFIALSKQKGANYRVIYASYLKALCVLQRTK